MNTQQHIGFFHPIHAPMDKIIRNNDNPSHRCASTPEMDALITSIATHGLICPIAVTTHDNYLMLVAGERRFTACQQLGWSHIPAVLIPANADANALRLIENLARVDLRPWDMVNIFDHLHNQKISNEQASRMTGASLRIVTKWMSIVRRIDPVTLSALKHAQDVHELLTYEDLAEIAQTPLQERRRLLQRILNRTSNTKPTKNTPPKIVVTIGEGKTASKVAIKSSKNILNDTYEPRISISLEIGSHVNIGNPIEEVILQLRRKIDEIIAGLEEMDLQPVVVVPTEMFDQADEHEVLTTV
jgi:ParB family transcriptional regulator, chromosome partitioning protein